MSADEDENKKLFGDDSSEDDAPKTSADPAALFGSDDEDDDNVSQAAPEDTEKSDIAESEEDGDEAPEEEDAMEEVTRLDMLLSLPELPLVRTEGAQIYLAKLPNFLHVEPRALDKQEYLDVRREEMAAAEEKSRKDGTDPQDDRLKDMALQKLKVENTIRWRYAPGETARNMNARKESNARFVKWSDGSMSLMVGTEVFDVDLKPMTAKDHQYLFGQNAGDGAFQAQAKLDAAMAFKPSSLLSSTHRKLTATVSAANKKTTRTKFLARLENPERAKAELEKMEAEKDRMLKKQRKERRRRVGGDFDVDDYSSDEEEELFPRRTSAGRQRTRPEGAEERRSAFEPDEYDDDFVVNDDTVEMASSDEEGVVLEDDDDDLDEEAERERDQRILNAKRGFSTIETTTAGTNGQSAAGDVMDGTPDRTEKRRRVILSDDEDE